MATGITLPKKTVKIENGGAVMMINDAPAVCPKVTRLLTPGNLSGAWNINGATCGSHCALFDITEKGSGFLIGTCDSSIELKQYQETAKPEGYIKAILDTGFIEH